MDKKPTIPFYAKIDLLEVGQFKPATFTPLEDNAFVCVPIPLTDEYVYNADDSKRTKTILTVEGIKYVFEKLSSAFTLNNKEVTPEDFAPDDKPQDVSDW